MWHGILIQLMGLGKSNSSKNIKEEQCLYSEFSLWFSFSSPKYSGHLGTLEIWDAAFGHDEESMDLGIRRIWIETLVKWEW